MIPAHIHLKEGLFGGSLERAATREGFGTGLVALGAESQDVVVLSADLAESTNAHLFKEQYPERYIEIGVAEQNLATVAAGFAAVGKRPFMTSYAAFSPGRNIQQIRTNIALNDVPVTVCGSHAGLTVGPDGATHQALEDIALMRTLPNMSVVVPADAEEARKATLAALAYNRPLYLRLSRSKSESFTSRETPFEIGKAEYFWRSDFPEVAIMASGPLLYRALRVADELSREGIGTSVLNLHSVKPMDVHTVIEAAAHAGAVVTVEEHQILGGVGSTVAEVLVQNHPVPMELVGVHDSFGQSGTPEELISHYGLDELAIKNAVSRVRARKHG